MMIVIFIIQLTSPLVNYFATLLISLVFSLRFVMAPFDFCYYFDLTVFSGLFNKKNDFLRRFVVCVAIVSGGGVGKGKVVENIGGKSPLTQIFPLLLRFSPKSQLPFY